jgi:hypothetical protein
MAAHDEKISSNRRRLFKALSATPVVLTLRPGSALANSSIVQCLADGFASDAGTQDFVPSGASCSQGDDCFAYAPLTYWEVPDQPPISTAVGADDLRGKIIVETDPEAGVFMTTEGTVISHRVLKTANSLTIHHELTSYHGMLSGGSRMLAAGQKIASDSGPAAAEKPGYHGMLSGGKETQAADTQEIDTVCYRDVPGNKGFFKLYAGTLEDPGTGTAVAYDLSNVLPYPQRTLNSDAGYQGIRQTCLLSTDPQAVSQFNFIKG